MIVIHGMGYVYNKWSLQYTYTNATGCDSVHTLNLTINSSNTGTSLVTACDSYIWDGVVYTTSGTYSNTYTNVAGCDSVHTLNLTINNSNTGTSSVTACDSYTWNGTTYTSSGTYSYTGNSPLPINGFTFAGTYNNSHYYISNGIDTWQNAQLVCNSLGGNLATISDQQENNFINNFSNYYGFPIGLWIGFYQNPNSTNYFEPSGGWEWINGDSINYTNWAPGQPDNLVNNVNPNGQDYAVMQPNGLWEDFSDIPQWWAQYYVLELPVTLTNAAGCDSVHTLNLTINNSSTGTSSVTT